jgi:hypothetical protein
MQNAQKFSSMIIGEDDGTPFTVNPKERVEGVFTVSNSFKHAVGITISWQQPVWIVGFRIQYFWSPDANLYFEDRRFGSPLDKLVWGKYLTLDYGPYVPPDACEKVKILVTNKNSSLPLLVLSAGCKLENSPSEP